MSATGRSYKSEFFKVRYIIIQAILNQKSEKKLQLQMKKYFVSIRLLTIQNDSHTDLRTSRALLTEKGCQYREKDSKNKILS